MDLFQLTYFVEVAHKKSFTKASKALHISQPSISKGIKALEEHWNIRLFDRKGKNVELTEMGAYLLPRIEGILNDFTALNEEMESPQLLNAGKLTVGVPPMIASSLISPFIGHFITSYPQIELELTEVGSLDIVSAIDDGLVQVGFVALPITTEMPYDFFIFHREPLEIVMPPDHRLAKARELTLDDIKDEPLVYYAPSFALNPYIHSFYQNIMAHPKIICQSNNWDLQIEMVIARMGIALLPRSICQRIPSGKAVHIPLVAPSIYWTLALIWKSKGFLSHPARTWVQSFKDYFKDVKITIDDESRHKEHDI
ncbi:LysR substrate-binding domain-containing protein [Megasphaera butyrica]|uniref:LysR family transcriptional regulator n=1 Tax=Megasphaera butyrica TaxID=2981791 RepID=UPI0008231AF3|nr:LysR substrate-binding domain-containing protein [Megasphaera butyrica]MCU6713680.1 LysR substrate-binding domain-containing protein [Megasphaera butyrica]SCH10572.1 Cyn operon transcriptional activator [uncultured Megasphaera sp.]SCI17445.1 Cyn operon transcriptional activator [uncultured Ruminococcus sp.]